MEIGNVLTYAAVVSWSLAAYMLPVVALLVWWRRRKDLTGVIQQDDVVLVSDDWLRLPEDE